MKPFRETTCGASDTLFHNLTNGERMSKDGETVGKLVLELLFGGL
jgi:hypothetical protein